MRPATRDVLQPVIVQPTEEERKQAVLEQWRRSQEERMKNYDKGELVRLDDYIM